ncbi:MAG: hypothetical protein H5T62_01200 [Anaerolineae bacterium]|nr:hypothetical protein [Anaerolineae bacterium]
MKHRISVRITLLVLLGLLLACNIVPRLATSTPQQRPAIGREFTPAPEELVPWNELNTLWGPYLAEREWGNPREALEGDGWGLNYMKAIDTAYRYGEDGIAGLTDIEEMVCFAWAFWDEEQPHITERLKGFTNPEGEFGEDIQEERVFWENTPTHSYMRYQYRYPFSEPRFDIEIMYAKRDDQTLIAQVTASALDGGTLHVLPKAWFRRGGEVRHREGNALDLAYNGGHFVVLPAQEASGWQMTTNETGRKGDLDRALTGNGALSNSGQGNMSMLDFPLALRAGESKTLRFALANGPNYETAHTAAQRALDGFDSILELRRGEAVALYRDEVTAHQDVYQYALMNLLWNRMYYEYDGSFESPYQGKVNLHDVVFVPDKWEFPWPAMWDTAFQAKVATLVDVELAKHELRVFLSDRWQLSRGHVPNCEWMMAEETPPLFAWAAWEIYQTDGDRAFLEEMWPRLELHYDYFRLAMDLDHDRLYRGGFMGMDNIPRPDGSDVEQADTSGWMAFFARHMVSIANELGETERAEYYQKHYEQTCAQINAQLWNEEDGFYYDRDGSGHLREKSYVGLIPFIAGAPDESQVERILAHLRNPAEFWSDYGIRSLSADSELYEPGYSQSGWKNSNWRGPVWLPINYLLVQTMAGYDSTLAEELRENLIAAVESEWQRTGHFFEYYHAETGEGLGADHQTGWTALVANLIHERWH